MATLIITRRLYLISDLQSVELPDAKTRRWNSYIEWTLGLVIPILVAGPIYYAVQGRRFQVIERLGCTDSPGLSILEILLFPSWSIIPPLVSIFVYYPRVARTFYRQNRDINQFIDSKNSVSRTSYIRILALASIDILLTLPIGIVTVVINVVGGLTPVRYLRFYSGWTFLHTDWEPVEVPYSLLEHAGSFHVAQFYFNFWVPPVLAFTVFAFFGVTVEARASYWRIFCTIGQWFGWEPTPESEKQRMSLGIIEFGERSQDISIDAEMGSYPSSVTAEKYGIERVDDVKTTRALDVQIVERRESLSDPSL